MGALTAAAAAVAEPGRPEVPHAPSQAEIAVQIAACAADVAYFVDTFCQIEDPQGDTVAVLPFHLWPAQAKLLWLLMATPQVLILKARQLGISWAVCAYALHKALFENGRVVLLFSKGQSEANELIRRILFMYTALPLWLQEALPRMDKDNTEELRWGNGSRIQSFPATQNAGRSYTASVVVMDEAAFQQWAGKVYTAVKPTVDNGGQVIILSTANGIGNLFHQLWSKAMQGLGSFRPVFLSWKERPGRDAAWYARQLVDEAEPGMTRQEYPGNPGEAFLVSGRVRFAAPFLDAQEPNLEAGIPAAQLPQALRQIPGLTVYRLPREGRRYLIGADVAEGLETGDWSHGVLIDPITWEEMAALHGHWEPDAFGDHLVDLARFYHAYIGVERNNHGHTTIARVKKLAPARLLKGHDGKYGWLTNVQTKPQSVDLLAIALRDGAVMIHSRATLAELRIYTIQKDGDTSAPPGYNDDRVMAWAIALMIARRPGTSGRAAAAPAIPTLDTLQQGGQPAAPRLSRLPAGLRLPGIPRRFP